MQPLRSRSQAVTFIFAAIIVVSIVAALSDLSVLLFLRIVASGGTVDQATANAIDARQAVIGIVQAALYLASIIAFLMWFYRAYKNLRASGYADLKYTPGWVVGYFFIPFLNLYRPYQAMKETWAGSVSRAQSAEPELENTARVGWWWALFLVTNYAGNLSGRLLNSADSITAFITAYWVVLAADLVDVPAALITLLLVRRITELQEIAMMETAPGGLALI